MKRLLMVSGCLVMSITVHAASFDCAKAGTKVEHLICDNPELSKLDEELSAAYKAALQDKQQADTVKQEQKQWMKERDGCADVGCVKQAYEARQSALASSDGEYAPQDTSAMSEKAKGEIASKILNGSEVTLRKGPYSPDDVKFCNAFLEDFKAQRGIEYIEPKFRTNDYNAPELAKLRNQCPNKFAEPKKCDAVALASWLKGYEDDEEAAQKKAEEMCATLFGTDKFALYEIDFGDHKEQVFSRSRTPKIDYTDFERLLRTPSKKELWGDESAWVKRTNKVLNVFFAPAGFVAIDLTTCRYNYSLAGGGGVTSPEAHLGLVKHEGHYLTYDLDRMSHHDRKYNFIFGGRNPVCHFDAVQSKSTNTGSAK